MRKTLLDINSSYGKRLFYFVLYIIQVKVLNRISVLTEMNR